MYQYKEDMYHGSRVSRSQLSGGAEDNEEIVTSLRETACERGVGARVVFLELVLVLLTARICSTGQPERFTFVCGSVDREERVVFKPRKNGTGRVDSMGWLLP